MMISQSHGPKEVTDDSYDLNLILGFKCLCVSFHI